MLSRVLRRPDQNAMAFAVLIAAGIMSMIRGTGVTAPGDRPRFPANSAQAQ